MEKWINLGELPKLKSDNNVVDWKNSVGYKVNFKYGEIEDYFEIIEYSDSKAKIYNQKYGEKQINVGNLKKGCLGAFLKLYTSDFKIEIGTLLKDDWRDLIILDRKYESFTEKRFDRKKERIINIKRKYYYYKCNKDNYEGWMLEDNLMKGIGCPLCSGNATVEGINDINTTNPDLVKFFINENDARKYSRNSHYRLIFKCPNCNTKKDMRIADLVIKGFSCPICNDGFSYPEKFVHSCLTQNNINFITQLSSTTYKWVGKYRYDFYLKDYNAIIEVNGRQHYDDRVTFHRKNLNNENENDRKKKELALNNNIKNYIVIDASESTLEWMREHILNSKLSSIINLNDTDWIKCEQDARKSRIYEVCKYKNEHSSLTSSQISSVFGIERSVIVDYLKIGNNLKWCTYSAKEEQRLSASRNRPKKHIIVKNEEGIVLGEFESCSELERQSIEKFGFKMHFSEVAARVNRKSDRFGKKYHEYIIEGKK